MPAYNATVCQPVLKPAFDADGEFQPAVARDNLERTCALIDSCWHETGSKLFVLPQFCFQGYAALSRQGWVTHGIRLKGPELKTLGTLAKATGAYIAGAAYEVCAEFPDRYWNTGFIVAPDGAVALTYRKHYAMTPKSRPSDVFDDYVRVFGRDALFPVLDTPLGRLGVAIAGDVNWPEMCRCLVLKGAEVILNPNSAPGYDFLRRPGAERVRAVRAYENSAYLLSSNPAGDGSWAPSAIFDYTGAAVAPGASGIDKTATAMIDIEALRRLRAQPKANFVTQLQPHLHADLYASADLWPVHAARAQPLETDAELLAIEQDTWTRMVATGIFRGPAA